MVNHNGLGTSLDYHSPLMVGMVMPQVFVSVAALVIILRRSWIVNCKLLQLQWSTEVQRDLEFPKC